MSWKDAGDVQPKNCLMDTATEIGQLFDTLKKPLDRAPSGMMDELEYRIEWLARSAELLADAQHAYDKARGEAAEAAWKLSLNATQGRDYITGQCADANRLLTLADKLNSTLVHQIDAIRTMLSYEKMLASGRQGP
jgi:hypothetical protein